MHYIKMFAICMDHIYTPYTFNLQNKWEPIGQNHNKIRPNFTSANVTCDKTQIEIKYIMINIEFDTRDGRSYFDM